MNDVDAVRFMASEHDLEFVDLDSYNVDQAAADILPEEVARQHHAVAVKRKFGTPVIALADPDDTVAVDALRAAVGREFIMVVALSEQIATTLDRVYGGSQAAGAPDGTAEAAGAFSLGTDAPERDDGTEELDDALGLSLFGSAFAPPVGGDDGFDAPIGASTGWEDMMATPLLPEPPPPPPPVDSNSYGAFPPSPSAPTSGDAVGIPGMGSPPGAVAEGPGDGMAAGAGDPTGPDGLEPDVRDPDNGGAVLPAAAVPPISELDPAGAGGFDPASADVGVGGPDSAGPPADGPGTVDVVMGHPEVPGLGSVEGAAELVDPGLAAGSPSSAAPVPEASALIGDLDALAAIASPAPRTGDEEGVDSVVLTADLVDEAVATFEGQHPEGPLEAADPATGALSAMPALARVLIEGDRVSIEEMEAVLEEHRQSGQSIARILTARRLVTEADLMWGMAQEMGLEFVDLDVVGVNMATAGLLPAATARHHNVLVIGYEQGVPVVAASNPTDVFAMDDLRTIMGRSFITVVATRSQLETYISRSYQGGGDAADMAVVASADFDGSAPETSVQDIEAATDDAPIVRYVNLLILQALNERASDIHVEPTASDLRIRYRIDGVLHDVSTAPRSIASAVTTRLKVMADMNIAEHRIPQDGRISLNVGTKGIDLRMATLPTIHGEKIVMRVLDKSSVVLGFSDLGFDDDLLAAYEEIYTKPYGTILVTGPTGSGKSTTLYTTLTALNAPEKNIITVEDPVELQIQGINQVQLNVKAGLTFASALKSILRSDPDIVLVGEIRDKETAIIAIEASLTGHLVLATLHTNSAASTPMRLIEMGLEPFMVTSSLSAVVAQRLARRLCVHCKEAYDPEEIEFVAAGWSMEEVERAGGVTKLYRAIGCSACSDTGYKGRKALVELMPMTEEIERLIIEGGSVDEIHRLAVAQGMVTLRQSGLRKAMEGETTLEEVLRVVA